MKYIFSFLVVAVSICQLNAQALDFKIHTIKLPKEIENFDNQFSGLSTTANRLYLLSESRLQDDKRALIYSFSLANVDKVMEDPTNRLDYEKISIAGLEVIKNKIAAAGQVYEGLEGIIIDRNIVYLSVETTTPSPYCYLLKGQLTHNVVYLDTNIITPVRKPRKANGESIYNAGFEAIAIINGKINAFYEYNYFEGENNVYSYHKSLDANGKDSFPINKLPFRITDITAAGNDHFMAINYFYKGGGEDSVYRVPDNDANVGFTKDKNGLANYCRFIDITFANKQFEWKPVYEFPVEYRGYNWEGIAAYKKGYFIINDKYTPSRPYTSTLLYFERIKN